MDAKFDVLTDVLMHTREVQANLEEMIHDLKLRGILHDLTKLQAEEFDAFVKTRPKFKQANYGTKEYQECVDAIRPAIDHHYAHNRHHVAYHENGFHNMNLLDILEMLADWKAAARRSPDLTFEESLSIAFEKYGIGENMQRHIMATLRYLGWIDGIAQEE